MTHQGAWSQQGILESQGIDLEGDIVDVQEVDPQSSSHADPPRAETRLHITAARPGDEGDVALDGLHLQPLEVPLAAPPWVGGGGHLH